MSHKAKLELALAHAMLGQKNASALMTDGYKPSMAQAGFPLREETFYFTCRRGTPLYIPCDLGNVVQNLLPRTLPTSKERAFLDTHGYGLNPAMEKALLSEIHVKAAPKGTWVLPKEPILTVTGPSFLVSWLEPLTIMLNFSLQVATALRKGDHEAFTRFTPSCQSERDIALIMMGMVDSGFSEWSVTELAQPDPARYQEEIRQRAVRVKEALDGDMGRAFEVGMRAATCMEQHELALKALQKEGITKTSNMYLAWNLYMVPVGTTGHEHQQRWAAVSQGDMAGFRAIRDMRQEPPSYLFDTISPEEVGIPTALEVMREDPDRVCSLRFDSGNQDKQFEMLMVGCREPMEGNPGFREVLTPNTIFEDGYTADKTEVNEIFCDMWSWPVERRFYGYGGYFVYIASMNPFGRNNVSAAFKLTQTGGIPVKKNSGSPGKASIPGKPVIFRATCLSYDSDEPISYIGQEDEDPPDGFAILGYTNTMYRPPDNAMTALSKATLKLVQDLDAKRALLLLSLKEGA